MQNAECRMQNYSLHLVFLFSGLSGGGDDGIRTHDPLLAGQVLSQLSYTPISVASSCEICSTGKSPCDEILSAMGICFLLLKDPSKLNNESN